MVAPPGSRDVLAAFGNALQRETHVLVRRPDLTWPQLFNQLQWQQPNVGSALLAARRRRTTGAAAPWLRLRNSPEVSAELIAVLAGHRRPVTRCAYSPDGKRVLSGSADGTIRLWDAATGRALASLPVGEGEQHSYWSPSGDLIAAAAGRTLTVWDAVSAAQLVRTNCPVPIAGLAFTPDGATLVLAGNDENVRLCEARTGTLTRLLQGHRMGVTCVSPSPDGTRIVSGAWDGTLRIWDPGTGALRAESHPGGLVDFCAFSPDGAQIVSSGSFGTEGGDGVGLWNATTGALIKAFPSAPGAGTPRVAFSPDGATLLITDAVSTSCTLWDPHTGEELVTLRGHEGSIEAFSFSNNSRWLATVSADRTVRLWSAESGQELACYVGHAGAVHDCGFSPDGRRIVSASKDETLRLWDATGAAAGSEVAVATAAIRGIGFSADGARIMTADEDGTLRFVDPESGAEVERREHVLGRIKKCRFSPGAARVATAGSDNAARVWDVATGALLHRFPAERLAVYGVTFSADGERLVTAGSSYQLRLWDLRTGKRVAVLARRTGIVHDCAFSPDGSKVAFAGPPLVVSRVRWPRRAVAMRGHYMDILACAFSPDGSHIATGSTDATARIWDVETGATVKVLKGHTEGVTSCAFSEDGRRFVSAGRDGAVMVWSTVDWRELAAVALGAPIQLIALHPGGSLVALVDRLGKLYFLEIEET